MLLPAPNPAPFPPRKALGSPVPLEPSRNEIRGSRPLLCPQLVTVLPRPGCVLPTPLVPGGTK